MYSNSLDGGWGWIVVASAFVAQLLSDGISYGFGILYVDLMATFQGTSAEISSIGSLSYGAFCFIGPVAGALTNKFGYRFVTILGAFLEALGVFLSAFTPNLEFLYFSVGILIGVGGGLIYIASFVCVSAYFESKRPLATSISSCGSSTGTFLFGFLYRVCIDYYGWRGALIVFAGLMLNVVICGTLFRPFANISGAGVLNISVEMGDLQTQTNLATQNKNINVNTGEEHIKISDEINIQSHLYSSTSRVRVNLEEHETLLIKQLEDTDGIYTKAFKDNERICLNSQEQCNLDKHTKEINKDSPHAIVGHTEQPSRIKSMLALLLGTTNVNLFKDVGFILYGVSTFLFTFGYGIPFVLLPDMAEMNGFTPIEAAWVISEFGISAIAGKFFFGAISQLCTKRYKYANVKVNSISVTLSGLFIACAPWAVSYPVLLTFGGAFGFLSAAVNTLVTLVLIELLGADQLADAFGWLTFFGGIGYITGPVVAGWLFDVTGTYIATFMAAGISLVLSGIVLFPIFISESFRALCKQR